MRQPRPTKNMEKPMELLSFSDPTRSTCRAEGHVQPEALHVLGLEITIVLCDSALYKSHILHITNIL